MSGCGGGGDGGGSAAAGGGGGTSTQPTLTGKAIDGYLVNAKVCVDLNDNNLCDAGEPQGKTDQAGNYSLAFEGDVTGKKLLVLVTPDTRDLSRPNYVFPAAFALTAPIDGISGQNVTPLTTMQQSLMEQGYSKEAAAKAVVSFVGGAVNLRDDYIANGDSTTGAFAMQVVDNPSTLMANGTGRGAIFLGTLVIHWLCLHSGELLCRWLRTTGTEPSFCFLGRLGKRWMVAR